MAFRIARRVLRNRSLEPLIGNPNSSRVVSSSPIRNLCSDASPSYSIRATLFPGDGIGPEIAESVKKVSILSHTPSSLLFICTDDLIKSFFFYYY
ncbi:hypothetical protein AQUCO_06400004v1 [Aquilegia coerulea]|uniref:Isopropylmalate dehydrogenase-like domain-containing protein n=1 Tax=Aquilegia coerulea TaxID=218851 RepID=A0A2G5CCF1_AQUCA|nr:hypothetical protein AQUCO_06400004v1 [Aquilegia coerulea]